jgi:hypothetical protein
MSLVAPDASSRVWHSYRSRDRCQADEVRPLRSGVRFENAQYRRQQLYSLWMARQLLGDGFVVMNCDVVLHPRLSTISSPPDGRSGVLPRRCGDGIR